MSNPPKCYREKVANGGSDYCEHGSTSPDCDGIEIEIYGHSDDIIEIRGDIHRELYANYGEDTILEFSTGHVVRVSFDGEWHFSVEKSPRTSKWTLYPVVNDRGPNNYSELLVIEDRYDGELEVVKR